MNNNYQKYKDKVDKLSQQIKNTKQLITTIRNGQNIRDLTFKETQFKVNTKILNNILAISESQNYIDCESCVTIGEINIWH
jgi:hypothetical protein